MKKIRINLYSQEFRPKKVILNLTHMLLLWLATFLIVAFAYWYTGTKVAELKQENERLLNEVNRINDDLLQTQMMVAQLRPNEALQNRLEKERELLDNKQLLVSYLQSRSDLKGTGYADFMQSLASIHQPNLAVTKFSLHGKNADIEGIITDSKLMADWVAQFNKYTSLNPLVFTSATITTDPISNLKNFALSSKPFDDPKDSKKKSDK